MATKKVHESWSFLQNQFYNQTMNSFKNFDILSTDHLSKLAADRQNPLVDSLYLRYEPLHQQFKSIYHAWRKAKGFQKGATQSVDEKQALLVKASRRWDIAVQQLYDLESVEHTSLFPKGRTVFQTSGREQRADAVRDLANALMEYPMLAALQVEVQTFYNHLVSLRDRQQQLEYSVDDLSDKLATAHREASLMMYRNAGTMLGEWGNVFRITNYFELSLIRKAAKSNADDIELTPETEPQLPENTAPEAPVDVAS